MRDDRDLPAVQGVDLTVHAGEIVALAGVDGNGQSELIEAITGLRHVDAGEIVVEGRDRTGAGARGMVVGRHLAHRRGPPPPRPHPELLDRREPRAARVPDARSSPATAGCRRGRWSPARARSSASSTSAAASRETLAAALSGGNQQKCVIAREIACNPRVLVAAQPTRGLDVGAIEFVHRRLVAERDAGRGILLMSLESEEVRSLADRILVIYEGASSASSRPTPPRRSSGSR